MTRARDVADSALIHLDTQTLNAVSTVSFNNVFNSSYKNYLLLVNVTLSSAVVRYRLRVSGSDASGSNYVYKTLRGNGTAASSISATETAGYLTGANATYHRIFANIFSPAEAVPTTTLHQFATDDGINSHDLSYHNVSTAYDGITIYPSSGNMSGEITIYAYHN